MSTHSRLIIMAVSLILMTLVINLVRTRKMHVSYGVVWTIVLFAVIVLMAIPPLLNAVTVPIGAVFPASALILIGFVFIFLALVFISVQLSQLSSRLVEIAQFIALNQSERSLKDRNVQREDDSSGVHPNA